MLNVLLALALGLATIACQTTHRQPVKPRETAQVDADSDLPPPTTDYALYEAGSIDHQLIARGEKARIARALSDIQELEEDAVREAEAEIAAETASAGESEPTGAVEMSKLTK